MPPPPLSLVAWLLTVDRLVGDSEGVAILHLAEQEGSPDIWL